MKSPQTGKRRSFAVIERNGKKNRTVQLESVNAVNLRLHNNELTLEQAKNHIREIIDRLYEAEGHFAVLHQSDNAKIVQRYWDTQYRSRNITDPIRARQRLDRAVAAVGHYSLTSASDVELQSEVDSRFKGNSQRSIIGSLNQLLTYLKRDFKLRKTREEMISVRYLNLKEFEVVAEQIKDPRVKLLCQVAFATGCRLGEIFALENYDLKSLRIDSQIDKRGIRRPTKNRLKRTAYVIEGFEDKVRSWLAIPLEERLKIRNLKHSLIVEQASKAVNKKCVFHDLRHSYAIFMLSKHLNITTVSRFLGNTVFVAEKYYAGRVATSDDILLAELLFKKNS